MPTLVSEVWLRCKRPTRIRSSCSDVSADSALFRVIMLHSLAMIRHRLGDRFECAFLFCFWFSQLLHFSWHQTPAHPMKRRPVLQCKASLQIQQGPSFPARRLSLSTPPAR